MVHHRRRRLPPRQGRAAEGQRRRGAGEAPDACSTWWSCSRTGEPVAMQRRPRPLVARAAWRPRRPTARPSRSTPSTRSSSSTPAAPPASPRASCTPPAATCCGAHLTTQVRLRPARTRTRYWCTADIGWVTGHSYVVYGPLANGATTLHVRGRARTIPEPDRFWEHHRAAPGDASSTPRPPPSAPSCAGASEWPHKHDLSPPAPAGHGRRADQPRGLDVVPRRSSAASAARSWTPGGRPRPARIMITPLPGATPTKPGSATLPVLRRRAARSSTRTGSAVPRRRGRLPGHPEALAVDAAHDLRRSRPLRRAVLEATSPASTSPATARAATRTATSGSWAASTT